MDINGHSSCILIERSIRKASVSVRIHLCISQFYPDILFVLVCIFELVNTQFAHTHFGIGAQLLIKKISRSIKQRNSNKGSKQIISNK